MSLTNKAIWQIEMRLAESCTLEDLASSCGVTTSHLVRAFRTATGLTPMSYQRARRLSSAAVRLKAGDGDILTIALDAQYASHEAFTRAFQSHYALRPSDVGPETNLTTTEPIKMNDRKLVDVCAPEIRALESKRIMGLSLACSQDNIAGLPDLWRQVNARIAEIPASSGEAYGVCYRGDGKGNFHYLAGMNVTAAADKPDDMETVELTPGPHAVFTFDGPVTEFPSFVYTIWNKALPETGSKHRSAPDFERYDGRFDVARGAGIIEVWIPVEP